jgi:hypothetical protein
MRACGGSPIGYIEGAYSICAALYRADPFGGSGLDYIERSCVAAGLFVPGYIEGENAPCVALYRADLRVDPAAGNAIYKVSVRLHVISI